MICANLDKERSRKAALDACSKLIDIGFQPLIEKQYENAIKVDKAFYSETDKLVNECDMLMTIGGDGTILMGTESGSMWQTVARNKHRTARIYDFY